MKPFALLAVILIVFIVAMLWFLMQPKKTETLSAPLIQAATTSFPMGGKG